ncbi:MAG: class I SAM-dependent methyltransferase, partial [Planctomycetota bacterium]
RPGGYLISETPCLGDWSPIWRPVIGVVRWLGKAPSIVHCLKAAEVEAMVADAGFEVLDSQIYNAKSGQQSVIARRV